MKDDFTTGSFTKPITEQIDELAELRERSKLEKEIREAEKEIKKNKRNRTEGVLEKFAFDLLGFGNFSKNKYKEALKEAVNELEEIK